MGNQKRIMAVLYIIIIPIGMLIYSKVQINHNETKTTFNNIKKNIISS